MSYKHLRLEQSHYIEVRLTMDTPTYLITEALGRSERAVSREIARARGDAAIFTSRRERGQNENADGLLRQYFPKAMELSAVTFNHVANAV